MSRSSWYSGEQFVCQLSPPSSGFPWLPSWSPNYVVFEQIHTLLVSRFIQAPLSMICSSISIRGDIRASWQLVPKMLTVCVIHSSGSSSSEIEGLGNDGLVEMDSILFLKSNFWGTCCQWKELVCQSIIGLYFWSQGNPKSIFCFPNPVTSNWIICFCPKISKSKFMYCLIVPFLFRVSSTLIAGIGLSRSLLSPTYFVQSPIRLCLDLGLSLDCPRTLLGLFLSEITAKQVWGQSERTVWTRTGLGNITSTVLRLSSDCPETQLGLDLDSAEFIIYLIFNIKKKKRL